jgi:hypothetical protein
VNWVSHSWSCPLPHAPAYSLANPPLRFDR